MYINDHPDNVTCNTILYSKCYQTSDLARTRDGYWTWIWSSSDFLISVDWDTKWSVDFIARKTKLFLLDWSNNTGAIDVKMDGSVLEEKSSSKMLGLSFSTKLEWDSNIFSTAKTVSKKIRALIYSIKFLPPEIAICLCKSTIQPFQHCCYVWVGAPNCY